MNSRKPPRLIYILILMIFPYQARSQSFSVTEIMRGNLSGLVEEDMENERLREQLKWTALYIKNERRAMSRVERAKWSSQCAENSAIRTFCAYIHDDSAKKSRPKREAREVPPAVSMWKDKSLLGISRLSGYGEPALIRSLSRVKKAEVILPLVEKLLSEPDCPSSSLLSALGLKLEEYFPNPEMKKIAIQLYSKASECTSGPTADRARYRAALFHISENRCDRAEALLTKLIGRGVADYEERAQYWRINCARMQKKEGLSEELATAQVSNYPMNYHTVLLALGNGKSSTRVGGVTDPKVKFRSQLKPELNDLVRFVELLQAMGEKGMSADVLEDLIPKLELTEQSFRLYVAILTSRAGDTLGLFRVLSGLFREDKSLITRSTLELFYPKSKLDLAESHGLGIDPMFILAIMRQESAFNHNARSKAGAMGLMQVMPRTARRIERVSKRELLDPKTNVRLGSKYLRSLLERFNWDAELTLAAYNAGPERVNTWLKRYPSDNRMLFFDLIPFKETREYVAAISRNYYWYMSLYEPDQLKERLSVDRAGNQERKPASLPKYLFFTMFDPRG